MNKKEFKYLSPTVTVSEIQAEGVLCMSLNTLKQQSLSHESWDEEDLW